MKILVACECSGAVRRAFRAKSHDAWSCDTKAAEDGSGFHLQGDVRIYLQNQWDMLIAFPPCTHLCSSGRAWFSAKRADGRQQQGIDFFMLFANARIPRICIENPIGIMSNLYRKPSQIIQPYWFGEVTRKATCLWLNNLPLLVKKQYVIKELGVGQEAENNIRAIHLAGRSTTRATNRSRTFNGVALAMADQWGSLPRYQSPDEALTLPSGGQP